MALDRPVHAPETTDGTTAPAVAAPVAPASVARGDLEPIRQLIEVSYRSKMIEVIV